MSVVEVKVGSRFYQVACEDGQERELNKLATEIDIKVAALAKQLRTNNEPLLLLMTALMMQDELNEFKKQGFDGENIEKKLVAANDEKDSEMAEILNNITGFIESVTDKLEHKTS